MQTKDYCLIREKDAEMVLYDLTALPERPEMLYNLSDCGGMPIPWGNRKNLVLIQLVIGIFGVLSGFFICLLIIRSFGDTYPDYPTHFEFFPLMMFGISSGIFLVLWLGFAHLLQTAVILLHLDYTHYIFETLRNNGTIIDGQIVSSKIVGNHNTKIEYNFPSPDDNEIVFGSYLTSTPKKFPVEGKVAVLYLNRYMHILL